MARWPRPRGSMREPVTCGRARSPGQGVGGRACSGVCVEFGECIHMGPPMQPTPGRLQRFGEGSPSRVETAFRPAGFGPSTLDLAWGVSMKRHVGPRPPASRPGGLLRYSNPDWIHEDTFYSADFCTVRNVFTPPATGFMTCPFLAGFSRTRLEWVCSEGPFSGKRLTCLERQG